MELKMEQIKVRMKLINQKTINQQRQIQNNGIQLKNQKRLMHLLMLQNQKRVMARMILLQTPKLTQNKMQMMPLAHLIPLVAHQIVLLAPILLMLLLQPVVTKLILYQLIQDQIKMHQQLRVKVAKLQMKFKQLIQVLRLTLSIKMPHKLNNCDERIN